MTRMSENKTIDLVTSLERRFIKPSNGAKIMDLIHSQSYWTLNMPVVESFKRRKTHLEVHGHVST